MKTATMKKEDMDYLGIKFRPDPINFPESKLAHQYLDGKKVIELGAAAHNQFGLDSVNVAPEDEIDQSFYRQAQTRACNVYAVIDAYGEADNIPFGPDDGFEGILSSHVIEHVPNPIKAFLEWNRILPVGGIIFMIFPKRDALESDKARQITPLEYFVRAYNEGWNVDTAYENVPDTPGRQRGHYFVFTLQSMLDLIEWCNKEYGLNWEILEALETDDKVTNGHCVVARRYQPIEPRQLEEDEKLEAVTFASLGPIKDEDLERLQEYVAELKVSPEIPADAKPLEVPQEEAIVGSPAKKKPGRRKKANTQ